MVSRRENKLNIFQCFLKLFLVHLNSVLFDIALNFKTDLIGTWKQVLIIFKAFQITSFLANLHNRVHVSILSITKIRAKQHPTYFLGNLKITLGQKCIHELCFLPKLVKVMKSFYHHGLLINIHHKDAFLFLQVVLVMESSFCQIRIFLTQQVNWCSTQKAMEWISLQMFWNLVV